MNSKIIDDSEGDRKIFRIQGGCGFPGFRGVFEMGGGGGQRFRGVETPVSSEGSFIIAVIP